MSKEITRIEGFIAEVVRNDGTIARAFEERRINKGWYPATLFISPDSTPPRVFTEEQVKAILQEIALLADGRTKLNQRFLAIITKHGITL